MAEQSNTILQWEHVQPERVRPHFSGKIVIAGHTPQTTGEPLDLGFLKVIDTDASRGGWLTALEMKSGEIIQTNQLGERRQPPQNESSEAGSADPASSNHPPSRVRRS